MLQLNETMQGESAYKDWSKTQVRAEAFNAEGQLQALAKREFTNHYQAVENLKAAESAMQGKVDQQAADMTHFTGMIQGLAQTLGSALQNLNFAASALDSKEKTYEQQQALSFQEIRAALANHTVMIGGNRAAIAQGVQEMLLRLDGLKEEIGTILDSDRGQMQSNDKDLADRISAMRSALNDDVMHLHEFASQVSEGLKSSVEQEATDVSSIKANITQANAVIEQHSTEMEDIKTQQDSIAADTRSNSNVLSSVSSKVAEAEARLIDLSKQLDHDSLSNQDAIQKATKSTDEIGAALDKQTASVESAVARVGGMREDDVALEIKEQGDFNVLKTSVAALGEQIARAEGIKDDLSKLTSDTKVSFDDAKKTIDGLQSSAKALDADMNTQASDIAGMLARLTAIETAGGALQDKSDRNKKQIKTGIEGLQAKLGDMLGLKASISSFSSDAFAKIKDIAASMDSLKASGDGSSAKAWKKIHEMSDKLDTHIAESGPMLTKATTDVTGLQKDVHDLAAFKSDTSNLQAKLVKELTDVTQSLGILDTKFSGQNVDVQGKIAKLENDVQQLPTKADVDKGIAQAKEIGNKNAQDLGDLAQKVDLVKAAVRDAKSKIDGVVVHVDTHIKDANDKTQAVAATLVGEGELLKKMAQKMKDSDLERKVKKVFNN